MGFNVAPTPIPRRSRTPIAIVAAAIVGVVGFALVASGPPAAVRHASPGPDADGPATVGDASPPFVTSSAAATAAPATLPSRDAIECHDLALGTCGAIAMASLTALPPDDHRVTAIEAWGVILCRDDFDCPRTRLVGNRPLGSAVVTLGSGARAWINVLEGEPFPGRVWEPQRTSAWIIRWDP